VIPKVYIKHTSKTNTQSVPSSQKWNNVLTIQLTTEF